MGAIILTFALIPVLLVVAVFVHAFTKSDSPASTALSEEELMAQQLEPIMQTLWKEAFEMGYVYAQTGEIKPPTGELPVPATASGLRWAA
jgi:hypothetical protein